MVYPLILGGLGVLTAGLFVGSQIDDAVEKTPCANETVSGANPFTTTNLLKAALLVGTSYVAIQAAQKAKII